MKGQDPDQQKVLAEHADRIESLWKAVYGGPTDFLAPYLNDLDIVGQALMDTKHAIPLKGKSVSAYLPYTDGNDADIRKVADDLTKGRAVSIKLEVEALPLGRPDRGLEDPGKEARRPPRHSTSSAGRRLKRSAKMPLTRPAGPP